MTEPTSDQRKCIQDAVRWFKSDYLPQKYELVYQRLPVVGHLAALQKIYDDIKQLDQLFETWPTSELSDIPEELIPSLKRALIAFRRHEAGQADSLKARTIHAEIIRQIDDRLRPFEQLLREPLVAAVAPTPLPRTADLLSIRDIENNPRAVRLAEREYDEKFHILQAPKLFIEDLAYYRAVCEERGTPVIAAYLDIDDFKKLNTNHGEVEVDRLVLPKFMQVLESQLFLHGFAYRMGGDEYVVLLPNFSATLAVSFLDTLRLTLGELQYPGIRERTTVSIGFYSVDSDCLLTDREIERRINRAKKFAKENGKNCIATYKDDESDELRVVVPR